MKIIGIYKITNIITGDFYIGSSKDVKQRWTDHKCPSKWNKCPNSPMYLDMRKYGIENFVFEILEVVEPEHLKETEQQFIEKLKPTYNSNRANGCDFERYKEYQKEYQIEYYQQNREKRKEYCNKYNNQLCCYNGELLKLCALRARFQRAGIPHPVLEAKKYLLVKQKQKDNYVKEI